MHEPLKDGLGRRIEYIRVSLTHQCNYAYPFCMPSDLSRCHGTERSLSTSEILRLCRIFSRLGVGNFKITGGEPLLHPEATRILENLKREENVACVTVTTNASTLDRHAAQLADMGLDGVNVSLNAISDATYGKVTGRKLKVSRILRNIDLACRLGLNIKLNMVPLRGINEADIIPVLEFALERGIYVRFIELMPIGQGRSFSGLSMREVKRIIEKRFGSVELAAGRFGNGPAVYYTVNGHAAKIGYIAAVSEQFCNTCNRIRLSSTGFLKTCLHHNHGVELGIPLWNGASDDTLAALIRQAVAAKPAHHEFSLETGAGLGDVPMYRIGG
ncbi:MAG: GTP 3',8-cyclase MoaA [Planctomycetes bacterium]|nr:GTP 3',8-cyclase MoaA [Planctomycetota bacterium]